MSKYIKYIGEDTLLDLIKTQAKREAHKIHIFVVLCYLYS